MAKIYRHGDVLRHLHIPACCWITKRAAPTYHPLRDVESEYLNDLALDWRTMLHVYTDRAAVLFRDARITPLKCEQSAPTWIISNTVTLGNSKAEACSIGAYFCLGTAVLTYSLEVYHSRSSAT